VRVTGAQPINLHPIANSREWAALHGGFVSDQWRVMYDPVRREYRATVKTYSPLAGSAVSAKWRRCVTIMTSPDGEHWQPTGRLVETDLAFDTYVASHAPRQHPELPAWSELHDLPLQRYEGLIVGFYNILSVFDEDGAGGKEICGANSEHFLAWSRDGVNWSRTEQRTPIIPAPAGTDYWD